MIFHKYRINLQSKPNENDTYPKAPFAGAAPPVGRPGTLQSGLGINGGKWLCLRDAISMDAHAAAWRK